MEYFIGFTMALAVAALGRFVGFQKDRAFYPTVLIIVGSYYVLFGAMAASAETLAIEIAVAAAFLIAAFPGFSSARVVQVVSSNSANTTAGLGWGAGGKPKPTPTD